MKSRHPTNKVLHLSTWAIFCCIAAIWIFYALFGHYLIDVLYRSDFLWIAERLMAGRAITPVEKYYKEAERILWLITLWVFPVFVVLMVLITKPLGIVISLMSILFCLIIGEFAVRFGFRDVTTTTDNSSYFARRWQKTIRENSWGFRERQFDLNKPKGFYRIAVIGDSMTYGQGIREEDRFTNLLEKRLASENSNLKYEVLNFGRPGADTTDEIGFLNDPVLKANPDFILLQWYTNDVELNDTNRRPSPLRLIPSDFVLSRLLGTSALFYLLNQQWINLQWKLGWLRSYQDYMSESFKDPNSPLSLVAKTALQKFINICKENKIPLGIVLFHDHMELDFLPERVLELCSREKIMCLDLRDTFSKTPPDQANRLDFHPGPLANRLVAIRLMETFGPLWLHDEKVTRREKVVRTL